MLQEKNPNATYGFFGYEGAMVDLAVSQDNTEDLKECIKRGFIEKDSRTLDNRSMVNLCQVRKAKKCEEMLLRMGWK